jgi:hypothetical protein
MNGASLPSARALARALARLLSAARTLEAAQRHGRTAEHMIPDAIDDLALAAVAWRNAERRHGRAVGARDAGDARPPRRSR